MAKYTSNWQSAAGAVEKCQYLNQSKDDLKWYFFTETKCKIRFIYVGFNCKRKIGVKKWRKKLSLAPPRPRAKKCCPVHLCYAPCIMYNVHTTLTLRNWSSTSIHLSWRSTWYIRASNRPENTKNALGGWYHLDKFLWLERRFKQYWFDWCWWQFVTFVFQLNWKFVVVR